MADLKEVFQKYGNNYEITMSRFMGNEQLYLKILAMLPRDENLRKPDQALQAGDYPAAFDAAHTLKGMAGSLGQSRLYQAVCAITKPLRTEAPGEYFVILFQSIKEEFERATDLVELLKEVE